ncbi:hypothetical protein HMPREF0971_00565 [Segatella oris F0302]|uniref:Uncharacterized protein n=1 Tax=Segatella oris F0302 TaxID=649760 RepID=D1QNR5_9BACT|nr:hypothetical protein HMPREF0971_00565 [Segatella oris F0302]
MLIFVSNVYNGLCIARVFEMRCFSMLNMCYILVVYNALVIRMLQKSTQNKD